jgi:TetR/AcrR family transcriptional regulator, cholesterol catabolism regulator
MTHETDELTQRSQKFLADFAAYPDIAEMSYAARRILAAAATLFYRDGAASTSVRDLTKACGLTPGALYNHFASRDEVLYVLVRSGYGRTESEIAAAVGAAGDDPRRRLIAYVRAYTSLHLRFPAFAQLAHREYVHLPEPQLAEINDRRDRLRESLIAILQAGATEGAFELIGGLSPAGQATMVLDICSRTSEWFSPNATSTEGLVERYVVAALRLVAARTD